MSPGPLPVGAPPAAAPHPAESAKPKPEIARAAREFEAIFIRKMLTSLEKASHVGKTGALSAGGDVYGSMMVGAVADAVAGAGGIGLASYVTKSLTPTPATAHPLHPTALHPTAHEAVPLAASPGPAGPAPPERPTTESAKDPKPPAVHIGR